MHACPVGIELFGDQHGQHRSYALANLRSSRHDGDFAVRGYADERERRQRRRTSMILGTKPGPLVEAEHETSARNGGHLQKRSTIHAHGGLLTFRGLPSPPPREWL